MNKAELSFVFVGSLSRRKAPLDIIHAIKYMPQIHLTIIGDGEQKKKIEKFIIDYKLKNIHLLGTKNNSEIQKLLMQHDVFIMPSHYDGWGAVVNEALTCGLYVICTDKTGAKELILDDKKRGLIYKAGNIAQLRKCIQYCSEKITFIQESKTLRIEWAEKYINGKAIANYFLDCLDGLQPSKPWYKS